MNIKTLRPDKNQIRDIEVDSEEFLEIQKIPVWTRHTLLGGDKVVENPQIAVIKRVFERMGFYVIKAADDEWYETKMPPELKGRFGIGQNDSGRVSGRASKDEQVRGKSNIKGGDRTRLRKVRLEAGGEKIR